MSKKVKNKKTCPRCRRTIVETNFYKCDNSPLYPDSRFHICTRCLGEIFENEPNAFDIVLMVLHAMNRPFLKNLWDSSSSAGDYIRQINSLHQYRGMTWNDSDFSQMEMTGRLSYDDGTLSGDGAIPIPRDELVIKWGTNYSDIEIKQLEQMYNEMMEANEITTPQHVEQLKLLCKVNLEQNKALADQKIKDFKDLNSQYNQILRDSGFRPIDRRSGGESTGIRTFSQIWEEIEKDGFIKPAPIEENQDIVDKTIMYMGNYIRKLLNINSMSEPPDDTPKVDGDDK